MPLVREYDPATGRFNYRQDPPDPSKPVMFTGPVSRPVTLADGTVVDVAPDFIECDSPEQAGEISHHIGVAHEQDGHPNHRARSHPEYDPFVDEFHHTCDASCGDLARSPDEQQAAFEARLDRLGYGHLLGGLEHEAVLDRLAAMRATAEG